MKLVLLGGGGFRTPQVHRALLRSSAGLDLEELVLHDVDAERLERIGLVLERAAAGSDAGLPVRGTTDLDDALEGAGVVFCAIRVGGLAGRVVDERVPLELGVLGQETTGPGGIAFALRTVPVMTDIAERVARRAPDAWFVNFTNPAGLVTEALRRVLGDRVVGICDSPLELCRDIARALDRPLERLWFDYFGLNHLGWVRAVRERGRDVLPELLADDERLGRLHASRVFGTGFLRALGMVPNEYLWYYDYAGDAVRAIRERGQTRAELLVENQRAFYEDGGDAWEAWARAWGQRTATYMAEARGDRDGEGEGGGADGLELEGYEGVAVAAVEALTGAGAPRVLILNTANRSSLPFLDGEAVVEVPCVVTPAGVVPVAVGDVPLEARALVERVKAVERLTIEAALSGSRELAERAIALHPLVPSATTARRILAGYVERQPALRDRFA